MPYSKCFFENVAEAHDRSSIHNISKFLLLSFSSQPTFPENLAGTFLLNYTF